MDHRECSLQEWAKDKPLSILQLDPADRAVLRIAGTLNNFVKNFVYERKLLLLLFLQILINFNLMQSLHILFRDVIRRVSLDQCS